MNGGWRGWGGVATMAGACALALGAALLPLGGHSPRPAAIRDPAPELQARYASARDTGTCDRSLNPDLGSTDGPAVQRIRKRGLLVVGVDQNSYLWGFRDPATGQLAGFDIDLVKAIAKDILGDENKVHYLTVPTAQRVRMIRDGTVDMVVRTMTVNCERAGQVAFSAPYFQAGQQILVHKDSAVTGYDDSLRGKRVCTADGSTGLARLTVPPAGATRSDVSRLGLTVVTVPNQLDCLVRLELGLADAVFTDNALAAGQAAQDPSVRLVGRPVTEEPYGVAMNQNDPDLVRRVNQVLRAYEAGGPGSGWMRSYDRWLAGKLPGVTGPPAPAYR